MYSLQGVIKYSFFNLKQAQVQTLWAFHTVIDETPNSHTTPHSEVQGDLYEYYFNCLKIVHFEIVDFFIV